jgi:hypothetical protein
MPTRETEEPSDGMKGFDLEGSEFQLKTEVTHDSLKRDGE